MAILNPCCCITLRSGAKLVAIVDLIVALILLIIFISDLTFNISQNGKRDPPQALSLTATTPASITSNTATTSDDDYESNCEDYDSPVTNNMSNIMPFTSVSSVSSSPYVTSGVFTILTVFLATNVGISSLLYTGSRNYSIRRCKWWFYIQTVITAVALIVLILIICFQVSFALVVLDLIHLLYRFYTLWVVYLFIGELTYLDTLCSLNKKGVSGFMYPTPMYTTNIPAPPVYNNGYPYAENPYQQHPHIPHYLDSGNGIASVESPTHYHSSDDGLPANGGVGGIDNPTYLH